MSVGRASTHSLDHGNVPSTYPSVLRHPSTSSPLCFSVGLLVAAGAVRSHQDEITDCVRQLRTQRPLTSHVVLFVFALFFFLQP